MIGYRKLAAAVVSAALAPLIVAGPAAAAPTGGSCAQITSYPPTPTAGGPFGVTPGPGGTWYANGGLIVRVSARGVQQQFGVPDADRAAVGWLSWNGGAKVWFSDRGTGRLGTIDARGHVVEYQVPGDGASPNGQVLLHGILWFTDPPTNRIGRLDPTTGRFTMFDVPTPDSWPLGITAGADGALWFTERNADKVGRMSTDGRFTEWSLVPGSFPNRIIVGPDHQIWFTELDSSLIGRIVHGRLVETSVAGGPVGITMSPDGKVYVALWQSKQLGRLDSSGHLVRVWAVPGALQVAASHGALWLTDPFSGTAGTVTRVSLHCRPSPGA